MRAAVGTGGHSFRLAAAALLCLAATQAGIAPAQPAPPTLSPRDQGFVTEADPSFAITNVE
ncbi:MAG: hypothetical protein ACXWUX_08545, partial [Allosphingosinicella sp.]